MFTINSLNSIQNRENFLPIDKNGREIIIFKIQNVMLVGKSIFYPNLLLYSFDHNLVYNPIKEKTMSLEKLSSPLEINIDVPHFTTVNTTPVFFFIYNTDNYYHFLYDTLPYLITFIHLKKNIDLKLLMNFPSHTSSKFYKFVYEFLHLLGITDENIIIADKNTLYKNIYISTSYTHDINSNLPPRNEIYTFYNSIKIANNHTFDLPSKIYISRRSWIHNDTSNIGTNYTMRRILENETSLVEYLKSKNYVEIFTEKLSTIEKISLFRGVTDVIGALGGGLSNVLFSNKNCNVTAICSPGFLDVNTRFIYSLLNTNLTIFNNTNHSESGDFKKYMRVKYNDIVGEISNVNENEKIITISYSDEVLSGWNSELKYKTIDVNADHCIKLDNGLNSAWHVDIDKLKELLQ